MKLRYLFPLSACWFVAACQRDASETATADTSGAALFETVAESADQWTGVAVDGDGQVFVNFPRWSDRIPMSVARLVDGAPVAFPDAAMNEWSDGEDPSKAFVCVQALLADAEGKLWVLDPANPQFGGVVEGGAKLMRFDIESGTLEKTYPFGPDMAPANSYLNDLRLDVKHGKAYLTDSGEGALIVLDLESGVARRLLDDHPSTHAEGITLTIAGQPWLMGGEAPQIHSDGIAYDAKTDTVFYQALSGRTMYKIPGQALRDESLDAEALAAKVEAVGETGASDGLICDPDGRVIISAIEQSAIVRTTPTGETETLAQDEAISWPDSFAWGPDGHLYFTTARIHEGSEPKQKYGVHRMMLK
ncbi:MAG: SMP-30/gluconolactonase/LRE family protein [Haloferula sp.]